MRPFPPIFALVLLLLVAGSAPAAEFRAELHLSQPGETAQATLYVKGDRYRVEKLDAEPYFFCIRLKAEDTVIALNPVEHVYKRLEGPSGAFADPLLGFELMAANSTLEPTGTVELDGRKVEHRRFADENTELEEWFDPALGFFVKRVLRYGGQEWDVRLAGIRMGPQDDSLFEVPGGYEREKTADEKERERPAVEGTVRSATPAARRLVAGGRLEVEVDPRLSARVKVENLLKDPVTYRALAFSGGAPAAHDPEMGGTLQYKGEHEEKLFGMQNRTDLLVVELESGRAKVLVYNEGESFGELIHNEHWIETSQGIGVLDGKDLSITLTGDSPVGGRTRGVLQLCQHEWGEDGREQKEVLESLELDLAAGERRELSYPAARGVNLLDFELQEPGGLKVITEQPR